MTEQHSVTGYYRLNLEELTRRYHPAETLMVEVLDLDKKVGGMVDDLHPGQRSCPERSSSRSKW